MIRRGESMGGMYCFHDSQSWTTSILFIFFLLRRPSALTTRVPAPTRPTMAGPAAAQRLSSISFSGAGFLGCYHMGAAACLLDQGYLLRPGEKPSRNNTSSSAQLSAYPAVVSPPILTGVSAGAIVSAAVAAGVTPDVGMSTILEIAKRTRAKGGTLDVFTPGFSLVDQVEDLLLMNTRQALGGTGQHADDYDKELFLQRICGGSNLRIGLTDKREFRPNGLVRDIPKAYRYIDQYRDVEDAVAACILSSYIPGVTGTLRGATCPMNASVRNSWARVHEMERLGFVKDGTTGLPVASTKTDEPADLYYWDGGLADVFPTIDDTTVIVSPVNGRYTNPSISPPMPEALTEEAKDQLMYDQQQISADGGERDAKPSNIPGKEAKEEGFTDMILKRSVFAMIPQTIQAHALASLGINTENAETLFRMLWSSDNDLLEERFRCGYDDAKRFLNVRSMLTTFS